MSAQPANTAISIFRTVRSYRQDLRHTSVEAIIKKLHPLIMSVPGREIVSGVLTRDTSKADFSSYMGEPRFGATRGFPIVIGLKEVTTFAEAQEGLDDIDFAFTIGRDKFITNSAAGLDGDLHADLRAV